MPPPPPPPPPAGFFLNAFSNDAFLEGLAQVHEQGLAQAVGSSNFNADRVRKVRP